MKETDLYADVEVSAHIRIDGTLHRCGIDHLDQTCSGSFLTVQGLAENSSPDIAHIASLRKINGCCDYCIFNTTNSHLVSPLPVSCIPIVDFIIVYFPFFVKKYR